MNQVKLNQFLQANPEKLDGAKKSKLAMGAKAGSELVDAGDFQALLADSLGAEAQGLDELNLSDEQLAMLLSADQEQTQIELPAHQAGHTKSGKPSTAMLSLIAGGAESTGQKAQGLPAQAILPKTAEQASSVAQNKGYKSIFDLGGIEQAKGPVLPAEVNTAQMSQAMIDEEGLSNRKPFFMGNNKKSSDKIGKLNKQNTLGEMSPEDFLQNRMNVKEQTVKSAHGNQFKSYGQGQEAFNTKLIKPNQMMDQSLMVNNPELQANSFNIMNGNQALNNVGQVGMNATLPFNVERSANVKSEKVLNLSDINASDAQQLVNKISDYLQQEKVSSSKSIDVQVHHNDLGQFKIHVEKVPHGTQLNMQIETAGDSAHRFFTEHEVDLMKSLGRAGIKLADFKISNTQQESGFFNSNLSQDQGSGMNQGFARRFTETGLTSADSGTADQGSDRRKELWEQYRRQYGAA